MQPRRLLLLLIWGLLLSSVAARAQNTPPPPPAPKPVQKVLKVQLVLPTVVGRLGEMTGVLVSRDKKSPNRTPTGNPVLLLSIPLPKFLSGPAQQESKK